jgi:twitching motility protein PilT
VTVEDILAKAHRPDDLAKRIVNARRGIEDETAQEEEFDHGH